MTNGEQQAIQTVEQVFPYSTDEKKMKKLSEEVIELAMAMQSKDPKQIRGELGDCAYVLLHILNKHFPGTSLVDVITEAKIKLEKRVADGYYLKDDKGYYKKA